MKASSTRCAALQLLVFRVLLFITKAFLGPTSPPHMSLPLPCTCGPHERARVVASSVRGARRRPATVGEGRGSITEARAQEWAFAMDVQEGTRERGRAVEGQWGPSIKAVPTSHSGAVS